MYAVIKTGGKQYRVQAGDLLVVEKLDGEPGAKIAFDKVLMIGEGAAVTLGEPTVAGASVSATLVETRKGEKIKVFKKIRRQGYRRTRGHRQFQSVLRVTGIAGAGKSETWDGTVDLTPLAILNARARNLARGMEAAETKRSANEEAKATALVKKASAKPATKKAAAKPKAEAPKVAPKAAAKAEAPAKPKVEAPKVEAPKAGPAKAETPAKTGTKAAATPAKTESKTPAKKAAAPAKAAPAQAKASKAPAAKKAPAAPAKAAKPAPGKAARKPAAKAAKPTGKKG
jgi:large subunit ribosomal protein L21